MSNTNTNTNLVSLYSASYAEIRDVLVETDREYHKAKRDRKPAEIIEEYRSLAHSLTDELKQRQSPR